MNGQFETSKGPFLKATVENPDITLLEYMTLEEKRSLLKDLYQFQSNATINNPWITEKHGKLKNLLEQELSQGSTSMEVPMKDRPLKDR